MNLIPRLHNILMSLLDQMLWKDYRHLNTFFWIRISLLQSGKIHLSEEWITSVKNRAKQAIVKEIISV